jgi:hypothetical protein
MHVKQNKVLNLVTLSSKPKLRAQLTTIPDCSFNPWHSLQTYLGVSWRRSSEALHPPQERKIVGSNPVIVYTVVWNLMCAIWNLMRIFVCVFAYLNETGECPKENIFLIARHVLFNWVSVLVMYVRS